MGDAILGYPTEGTDFTSISDFPGNPPGDQNLTNMFPLSFSRGPVSVSPALNGVDANFNPFFNFDAIAPQLHLDDLFFANFFDDISMPTVPNLGDTEEQLAHLETLKKHQSQVQEHQSQVQERIQSLYVFCLH